MARMQYTFGSFVARCAGGITFEIAMEIMQQLDPTTSAENLRAILLPAFGHAGHADRHPPKPPPPLDLNVFMSRMRKGPLPRSGARGVFAYKGGEKMREAAEAVARASSVSGAFQSQTQALYAAYAPAH